MKLPIGLWTWSPDLSFQAISEDTKLQQQRAECKFRALLLWLHLWDLEANASYMLGLCLWCRFALQHLFKQDHFRNKAFRLHQVFYFENVLLFYAFPVLTSVLCRLIQRLSEIDLECIVVQSHALECDGTSPVGVSQKSIFYIQSIWCHSHRTGGVTVS